MKYFYPPAWNLHYVRIAYQRLFGWEPMETTIKYKYQHSGSDRIKTNQIRVILNKITQDMYIYTHCNFTTIDTINNIFLIIQDDLRRCNLNLAGYHRDLISNIDELKFGKIYSITPPSGEPKELMSSIENIENDEEWLGYLIATCKEKNLPVIYHSEDVTQIIKTTIKTNHRL